MEDLVNKPPHYLNSPYEGDVSCQDFRVALPSALADAFKYIWRAGKKTDSAMTINQKACQDIDKAVWYLHSYDRAPMPCQYPGIVTAMSHMLALKDEFKSSEIEQARIKILKSIMAAQICLEGLYRDITEFRKFFEGDEK